MATNARIIEVPAGQEQVQVTDWDRVRILGLGLPAWDRLKENHGIDQTDSPTVAVVLKLTADGIAGSSFIVAGVGDVEIPLKRICPEASGKARLHLKCDLMEFQWPRETDCRNISLWKDLKANPNTKITYTRTSDRAENRITEDTQLYEGLSGILVRAVLLLGVDLTVYVAFQLIPQSLEVLRESLLMENGTPAMDPQSPMIPAIWLAGKDTGLQNNARGRLVPGVSDTLAKDSGLGVVPLIFCEGGLALAPPPLAAVKFELWSFLRKSLKPANFPDAEGWLKEFEKDDWAHPTAPILQWPEPDQVQALVNNGE